MQGMIPELQIVTLNLVGNARKMIRWGRQLAPEHLDFSYSPAAPTPVGAGLSLVPAIGDS